MAGPIITLLTDFGHRDPFVGIMKGQILKLCPTAQLVDLTHEISPQDVRSASYHLEQSIDYFPDGTIHLAVVDPGVGTSRAILAVRTETALFVTPDNGLLTRALRLYGPDRTTSAALEIVRLPTPPNSSSTFHGRDVMAPAAARLASGCSLNGLGTPLGEIQELDFPPPRLASDRVHASVLIVDHFGNVTLDLSKSVGDQLFTQGSRWILSGRELKVGQTYADVPVGASLLLWSSHGLLELACREGRADQDWGGLGPGARVELKAMAGSQAEIE